MRGAANGGGTAVQETIYLGDAPVGIWKASTRYYIQPDHLNTARAILDQTGTVIWLWKADPFGTTNPTADPDANGVTFAYNLRFPGQYYDQETGLFYNYFRDYDPRTGRYVQSDPVGLGGGLNTFGYVGGNPIAASDAQGLLANVAVPLVIRLVGGRAGGAVIAEALRQAAGPTAGTAIACVLTGYCSSSEESEPTSGEPEQCPTGSPSNIDDYPADPDDWTPPEGWSETSAGEKTGGRHRQWRDENGELARRWDREGGQHQGGLGPHWWDKRDPKKHIEPNR